MTVIALVRSMNFFVPLALPAGRHLVTASTLQKKTGAFPLAVFFPNLTNASLFLYPLP